MRTEAQAMEIGRSQAFPHIKNIALYGFVFSFYSSTGDTLPLFVPP
jgi:hypothetical protein